MPPKAIPAHKTGAFHANKAAERRKRRGFDANEKTRAVADNLLRFSKLRAITQRKHAQAEHRFQRFFEECIDDGTIVKFPADLRTLVGVYDPATALLSLGMCYAFAEYLCSGSYTLIDPDPEGDEGGNVRSLITNFNTFASMYKRKKGKALPGEMTRSVTSYIRGDMAEKYGLSDKRRQRAVPTRAGLAALMDSIASPKFRPQQGLERIRTAAWICQSLASLQRSGSMIMQRHSNTAAPAVLRQATTALANGESSATAKPVPTTHLDSTFNSVYMTSQNAPANVAEVELEDVMVGTQWRHVQFVLSPPRPDIPYMNNLIANIIAAGSKTSSSRAKEAILLPDIKPIRHGALCLLLLADSDGALPMSLDQLLDPSNFVNLLAESGMGEEERQIPIHFNKDKLLLPVYRTKSRATLSDEPWNVDVINRHLARLSVLAGLPRHVTTHDFRHTGGRAMFADDDQSTAIASAMGHQWFSRITSAYMSRLNTKDNTAATFGEKSAMTARDMLELARDAVSANATAPTALPRDMRNQLWQEPTVVAEQNRHRALRAQRKAERDGSTWSAEVESELAASYSKVSITWNRLHSAAWKKYIAAWHQQRGLSASVDEDTNDGNDAVDRLEEDGRTADFDADTTEKFHTLVDVGSIEAAIEYAAESGVLDESASQELMDNMMDLDDSTASMENDQVIDPELLAEDAGRSALPAESSTMAASRSRSKSTSKARPRSTSVFSNLSEGSAPMATTDRASQDFQLVFTGQPDSLDSILRAYRGLPPFTAQSSGYYPNCEPVYSSEYDVNGGCPCCRTSILELCPPKGKAKTPKKQDIFTHIQGCFAQKILTDAMTSLVAKYSPHDLHCVLCIKEDVIKARYTSITLRNHATSYHTQGDDCGVCGSYVAPGLDNIRPHSAKHGIYITPAVFGTKAFADATSEGVHTTESAKFPPAMYSLYDDTWHVDPADVEEVCEKQYNAIMSMPTDGTTIRYLPRDDWPDCPTPQPDGSRRDVFDDKYIFAQDVDRMAVTKHGPCFLCLHEHGVSFTKRITVCARGSDFISTHLRSCFVDFACSYRVYDPIPEGDSDPEIEPEDEQLDGMSDTDNAPVDKKQRTHDTTKRALHKVTSFCGASKVIACPDTVCKLQNVTFSGIAAFFNHVAEYHWVDVQHNVTRTGAAARDRKIPMPTTRAGFLFADDAAVYAWADKHNQDRKAYNDKRSKKDSSTAPAASSTTVPVARQLGRIESGVEMEI